MDTLNGDLGDAIKEINAVMGENQARRENLQEQYLREVLEAVLTGKESSLFDEKQQEKLNGLHQEFSDWSEQYKQGNEEAGFQMERLYEEAQTLGKSYFDNSSFMKTLTDIEIDEITAIRENTAGLTEATQASYRLSQELSKGRAGAWTVNLDDETTTSANDTFSRTYAYGQALSSDDAFARAYAYGQTYAGADDFSRAKAYAQEFGSHAYGLNRVPYDNYPALLHEGERVLTAAEARAQGTEGASISLVITGNSFAGTSEEMADQMWEIIMRKLEQAYTAAAPK